VLARLVPPSAVEVSRGVRREYGLSRVSQGLRERPEVLAHPTAEAGSSPAMSLSSPEPRREVEGGSDGRDPPVSGLERRTAPARDVGSSRAVLGRVQAGHQHSTVCFFSFLPKNA